MACCQSSTVWCQCSGTWNAVTDTVMSIIIPLLVNDYKTSWNAGYFMLCSAFSGISIELGCDLTKCDFSFGDCYSCGLPAVSFWHHLWGHTVFFMCHCRLLGIYIFLVYLCFCCSSEILSSCQLEDKACSYWPQQSFHGQAVFASHSCHSHNSSLPMTS